MVCAWGAKHVSAYSIIIEDNTPLSRLFKQDRAREIDSGLERQMYYSIRKFLNTQKIYQYEISNYARKKYKSRHNLKYWECLPYLGMGLGAASYYPENRENPNGDYIRESNTEILKDYCMGLYAGSTERISREEQMNEFMMLGFRKLKGPSPEAFAERFGCSYFDRFSQQLERLEKKDLITIKDGARLTTRGLDYANDVFREFLLCGKRKRKYTVNVREMVEFLLRHGDIVPGDAFFSPERALLGADLHRKLQGLFKTEIEGYTAEKGLRFSKEANGVRLEVEGRCDGFYRKDGVLHVDEIKTVDSRFREENGPEPLHTAQAVCYAAILEMLPEYRSEEICIHILYYHVTEKSRTEFRTNFTESELLQYFNGLVDEYIKWISWEANRRNLLQQELCALKFPFPSYRRGQRELAVSVYKTITKNSASNIYVNAPTGIGKTISVLFPVLKAMCAAESGAEIKKIFYLTATNAGAGPPAAAAALLGDQLPELLTISLTSKEKICPLETPDCNPDTCSRARGHYDRINACLYSALLSRRQFTKEEICALSERHEVCPFELQLDLSLWCDLIIGDYNYLFDPTARLQRYFGELQNSGKKEPYVYLIDEAHNLPDRAREMYTARIQKKPFLELMRLLKGAERKTVKTLRKRASALNSFFLAKEKELERLPECSEAADPELIKRCADYTESAYELLKRMRFRRSFALRSLRFISKRNFFVYCKTF